MPYLSQHPAGIDSSAKQLLSPRRLIEISARHSLVLSRAVRYEKRVTVSSVHFGVLTGSSWPISKITT